MNAIITGASSGIGRDMAIYLAMSGHTVYAAARREYALNDLSRLFPGKIIPFVVDLSQTDVAVRANCKKSTRKMQKS